MSSIVRPERPEDGQAVLDVVRAAFGQDDDTDGSTTAALVSSLRASGHVRASLVAEEAGTVVGHVQLNRSWLDAAPALVEVVVLSPLSVAPDRQGRGIGTALVAAAVRAAGELEAPAAFLEGSPAYYGTRGFEPAGPRGFHSPSGRIPEAAFQVALLPAYRPWMTGRLVYCDPFWAHDCVGLRGEGS